MTRELEALGWRTARICEPSCFDIILIADRGGIQKLSPIKAECLAQESVRTAYHMESPRASACNCACHTCHRGAISRLISIDESNRIQRWSTSSMIRRSVLQRSVASYARTHTSDGTGRSNPSEHRHGLAGGLEKSPLGSCLLQKFMGGREGGNPLAIPSDFPSLRMAPFALVTQPCGSRKFGGFVRVRMIAIIGRAAKGSP